MKHPLRISSAVALVACAILIGSPATKSAWADGADITVSDLPDTPWNWGSVDGVQAFSVGTTSCNSGDVPLQWIDEGDTPTLHPVIAQNLYRLLDGRFEHIGQSWLKHGFCAVQSPNCGDCESYCQGCCDYLGVGCSDAYGSFLNGVQSRLGPKSEVNPSTGEILVWPHTEPGSGSLDGRLQVNQDDLDPDMNAGALYFTEGHYVTNDDALAGNQDNNASHRQVTVGAGPDYDLSWAGGTVTQQAAIQAWPNTDPTVTLATIDVPEDGRLILAHKASDLGDGMWHYEYALYNMFSDRGAQAFSVPLPLDAAVSNFGFHDVDYHSGESYSPADWDVETMDNALTWATQTYETNTDANALRWSTLYNFRFDSDGPPETGDVIVVLFKPGDPGSMVIQASRPGADCNDNNTADSIDIDSGTSQDTNGNGIPDECEETCEGDANGDGTVDPLDSGYVLARFGCSVGTGDDACDAADQNRDGAVDPLDSGFVLARFGPCP